MFKGTTLILFFISIQCVFAQITLTHNIGNIPIKTDMDSCEREEFWARTFVLSDFGISTSEQFIITSGQVAVSNSYEGARLVFNFYSIDSDFPNSEPQIISTGNLVLAPEIGDTPEIVDIDFNTPITIPTTVERILVEVTQMDDIYNDDYKKVLIAGTQFDDGSTSWFKGCREYYSHVSTEDLTVPVHNANFFINVTGEKFSATNSGSTATLTHNFCGEILRTSMFSCSYSKLYWARLFALEDFGVSANEELIINFGQIGISSSDGGTGIQFNIYEVDDNFPSSFSETNLIGSSQVHRLPYISQYFPQIVTVNFDTPITVPSHVKKILVEVTNVITWGSGAIFISGTEYDEGDSWYRGCGSGSPGYSMENYVTMVDPAFRKSGGYPDAKFYINVTGNVNHVSNNFNMNVSNICSEFLKEFGVVPNTNVASVTWDFGDPASGAGNTSTDLSPYHDFTVDGVYTVSATVLDTNGNIEVITETIDVKEPPNAYGINDIYSCEDNFNTGISSTFDVSTVRQQVLGGQNNKIVTFIDGSGNEYDILPNPFTNTIANRETITVRVAHDNNPCCYSETTFDLITNPLPDLTAVSDLFVCSNETDGFAVFDLQQLYDAILAENGSIGISFYHENGIQIQAPLNAVENLVVNEEEITIRAIEPINNCSIETTFKLMANPLPVANALDTLIGCDDNNDGISEYFDTSNVESEVVGSQTNMLVSYFDADGTPLPSPLPNPYTNRATDEETIMVRVTNPLTNCFEETPLVLKTTIQPQINVPQPKYACNNGSGFAQFDTSEIESEIIGGQIGLRLTYFTSDGVELPSPLPLSFQNTEAWNQTINVRVENELNSLCYTETSFDLIVQKPPMVSIEESYFICNLEPFLSVSVDDNLDSYYWTYQDGSVVSNTNEANLIDAGVYTLLVSKLENGIYCENSFDFELIRSSPPTIVEVLYQDLSRNNSVEIIATGDGEFEYSIDGINFQDSNYFTNILGGSYTAQVRDKLGCGEDSEKVTVVDYPKFFTPNLDGNNDFWHILGIDEYPNSIVLIFDRYGKLLKQLSPNDIGWDGTYNGSEMLSNDYWFKADLGNGTAFSGHFTLKR